MQKSFYVKIIVGWSLGCLRRQCLTYSIVQSKELNIAKARKFVKRLRDPLPMGTKILRGTHKCYLLLSKIPFMKGKLEGKR